MQGNRSRDTRPELAIRREVHRLGLRYRISCRPEAAIRRTADLVFRRTKVAVFIDGCYWHGCPEHFHQPRANVDYWAGKIGGNVAHDRETDRLLRERGWEVVRIWEHQEPAVGAKLIASVVQTRRALTEPVAASTLAK